MTHDFPAEDRPGPRPDDAVDPVGGVPARRRLGAAGRSARTAGSRHPGTGLLVAGLGMSVLTLTVGLVESRALSAAVFAAWGVVALGLGHWERYRARHGGAGARAAPLWGLSFAGYAVAIAAGTENAGDPAYWVPAALLVPLPLFVGALRERRDG